MKKILFSALMGAMVFAASESSAQTPKVLKPTNIERHDFAKENQKFEADQKRFEQLVAQGVDYENIPEELQYLMDPDGSVGPYVTVGDGCSWYCGGGPSKITASSHLAPQGKYTYEAKCAHDFSLRTPWCEGVDGNGVGEWLLYDFEEQFARITTIYIANGFVLNNATYQNNARAKKIRLDYNGKPYAILELEDVMGIQSFEVKPLGSGPEKEKPFSLKFTILEVYPGAKYQDLCISEIWFSGLDVHCFPAGTMVTMANGNKMAIENIRPGHSIGYFDNDVFKTASVKEVTKVTHNKFVRYTLDNGISLTATPDHPIMCASKGWVSCDPSKSASCYKNFGNCKKAEIGDVIITSSGHAKIVSIEQINEEMESYTIVKAGDAKSFIANGVEVGIEEVR